MEHKVTGKQFITEMCFGCGMDNGSGLHGRFYNLADGSVAAVFEPGDVFQGYPQRLHGGVTASMLDEVLGRAILPLEPDTWAVTAELTIRYKKPVPLQVPLIITAKVTDNNRRLFHSSGEMILPDGEVAATATGVYMKQPLERIADMEGFDPGKIRYEQESDVLSLEY
ncbi:MAG: PaaI family thioesterase [Clostridiales bacterium]|nr:PaaI family thioesterase [Clostridiales bacterium]